MALTKTDAAKATFRDMRRYNDDFRTRDTMKCVLNLFHVVYSWRKDPSNESQADLAVSERYIVRQFLRRVCKGSDPGGGKELEGPTNPPSSFVPLSQYGQHIQFHFFTSSPAAAALISDNRLHRMGAA
jgi:hypothetical protein